MAKNELSVDDSRAEALRYDWCSGSLSLRLLSIKYQMQPDVIEMQAVKCGWGDRGSMATAIERSASRALIDRAVQSESGAVIDEARQLDAYGQLIAGVVESHRNDVNLGRSLARRLLDEIEAMTPVMAAYDDNAVRTLALALGEQAPTLRERLLSEVAMMTTEERVQHIRRRIVMLSELSGVQATYIALERETWGLNAVSKPGESGGIDDMIDDARR
jgi:hypothetical protein